MSETAYYFAADRDSRTLVRRKRGAPGLHEINGQLWWRVDKATWKAYRAGDVVAIGDWPPEPPRLRSPERRER